MKKRAVLIVGHGSKLKGFQTSMEQLARRRKKDKRFPMVLCAYLEITPPSILEAICRCVQKGANEIMILPYFLLMGNHVKSDIPHLVSLARKKYRLQAKIVLCPYLGYHENILEVVKERLRQAL